MPSEQKLLKAPFFQLSGLITVIWLNLSTYSNTCFIVLLCRPRDTHAGLLGFHSHHQHQPQSSAHSAPSTQLREKAVSLSSVLQTEPMVDVRRKKLLMGCQKILHPSNGQNIGSIAQMCDLEWQLPVRFYFNHRLSVCVSAARHSEHQKPSAPSRSSHVSVISKDAFKFPRLCLCSVCKAQRRALCRVDLSASSKSWM